MMRALVTGGGGFLGLYLVEALRDAGYEVASFSRQRYDRLHDLGVEQWVGDIRDDIAIAQACLRRDVVFHVAALAGIGGTWSQFYGINTLGTRNVVAGCRSAGVSRLVYCSSPSVTFSGQPQCGEDESAPYATRWLAHYPRSKAMAEQEVLRANSPELRTCALRPHLIWGPRDQHLIPRLLERARANKLVRVGDGTNLVDMTYVENAALAHLQAAQSLQNPQSPVAGRAYFLSQGEPVRCWDWINQILQLAGLPQVRRGISFRTAWWLGGICEGAHVVLRRTEEPRMSRFLAAQLALSHYFDISAARRDFGYEPQISSDEGMRRLANWLGTR